MSRSKREGSDLSRRELMQAAAAGLAALTAPCELLAAFARPNKAVDAKQRFPYFQSEPVSYLNVKMQDAFWAPRQRVTRKVSVPWITSRLDAAGGVDAYRKAGGGYEAKIDLHELEHVKFIEAMATLVGLERDAAISGLMDAWGGAFIAAQGADGYLAERGDDSSARPRRRWEAAAWSHEDYAIGHYLESAIAHREATGDERLFQSAVRAVDCMAVALLEGKHAYTSGHPEIEQALTRLYGVTGETKYLQLSGWLLDQRGRHENRRSFGLPCQDHVPIREQRTIEGHAVRAGYLFNGVTEYVGATGDAGYRDAVLAVWRDFSERKMYLHGAGGCLSARNEGYLQEPDRILPDDTYGESCSVFGNFQWAHNLFRLTGEAHYLDTAERMLYNAFYASLSLAGDSSFYCNVSQTGLPRASMDEQLRYRPISRSADLATSCCPPNIVKLFNKVGGFFYSVAGDGIYVKHYGASEADVPWGRGVTLTQQTQYPWDGTIRIRVESRRPEGFALHLRLPAWAKSHTLAVNGEAVSETPHDGWLTVRRRWRTDDEVLLKLVMEVERVRMPPQFIDYENKAALQRGAIVYCLEDQDVEHTTGMRGDPLLSSLYIPESARFTAEHRPGFLGGVTVLRGHVSMARFDGADAEVTATFVPYGFWGNRQPGAMRIWLGAERASFIETHGIRAHF